MSKVITSLFHDRLAASTAVDRLVAAGFGTADISVLMAQDTEGQNLGAAAHGVTAPLGSPRQAPRTDPAPGHGVTGWVPPAPVTPGSGHAAPEAEHAAPRHTPAVDPMHPGGRNFALAESSKAPEGATAGATVGGALGGILMGLAATGLVLIPGVNLVAAGPLLAVLAGIGGGGAVGGLLGGLLGLGIPEHEAKLVEQGLSKGNVLVGVRAHADRVDVARKILREAGGTHVH